MKPLLIFAALFMLALIGVTFADSLPEFTLVLKNHVYQPSELKIPAGTKFKIIVRNEDATPEEFESTDFGREKIVPPNSSIEVYVGPLKAGTYGFFGDFHQDTAKGRLIVE
jgi:plastocyanin domain-containing protein